MAELSSVARSNAVYFIISLHTVFFWHVECQDGHAISYEYMDEAMDKKKLPLVLTAVGLIRGIQEENYAMFLGIPYGKIDPNCTLGPSQAYPKFENTFEANNDTAVCPQLDDGTPIGTLDCLKLNIYVPKSTSFANQFPVLVWIHGGGEFETGSGRKDKYGPEFLIRHNIILVTVNYRLGIYGFFCGLWEVHGNQGLKDQRLAFRWIKKNIEAFGGDANKMTLGGEGSGSVCVDLHLHSPQARLFSKFILQGQTILSPNYTKHEMTYTHIEITQSVLKQIDPNSTVSNVKQVLVDTLDQQKPEDIVRAVGKLGLKFGLCTEGGPWRRDKGVEKFLQYNPRSEKFQSQGTSKPILIGSNEDALLHMYAGDNDMTKMASAFKDTLHDIMNTKNPVSVGDFAKRFREFYMGDKKIDNDVKRELIDFQSDYNIWHPLERSIEYYHRLGAKVYRYVFSYIGERNYMKYLLNLTSGGATSTDELGYLFDMKIFDQIPNPQDQHMIDRITTLWANFIKYGNPTYDDGDSELLPVSWPQVTKHINQMPYLALNSEISIKDRPFKKRMAFWKMLYEHLRLMKKLRKF